MKKYKLSKTLLTKAQLRIVSRKNFLLKHNLYPYYKLAKSFNEGNNRAAIVHAVGTGKSFIAMKWLADELKGGVVFSHNRTDKPIMVTSKKDMKVLYLAPKLAVFDQIKRHIEDVNLNQMKNNIEFITYSGLLSKFKKAKGNFDLNDNEIVLSPEEETEFEKYISKFTHIVLDEFHHAEENKWGYAVRHALSDSKAKVLGLTATPIRSTGTNTVDTIFNGNVVSTISMADAIVKEILPMPIYQSSIYSYNKIVENYSKKIQRIQDKDKRIEATRKIDKIKNLILKSKNAEDIIVENFKARPNGKFIVFCDGIASSEKLKQDIIETIEKAGLNLQVAYNVNTDNSHSLSEIQDFEKTKGDGLKLLFAVDMLNESVHVKGVDGVIMLRDTQSFIVYVQQLGRALAATSENYPLILDLVNNIDSAFEYREDNEGVVGLFKEVADRTNNKKIKDLAMKAIQENKIMKKFRELDEFVGIKLIDENLKLEILTDMKNHGYDLNKLHRYIDTNEFYEYAGEEYTIKIVYGWIKKAKEGLYSDSFIEGLKNLGIYFDEKQISPEKKIKILKQAIKDNADGIIKQEDGSYRIYVSCVYKGHHVGKWVEHVKYGKSKEDGLREEMEKLNIDFSTKIIAQKEKIEIVKKAIKEKVKGIKFNEDGTIVINNNCKFGDYAIGRWIEKAKIRQSSNKEFLEALSKMNIDISAKRLTPQEKIEILRKAIEEKVKGINQQADGTYRIAVTTTYKEHNIGWWISSVKQGEPNHKDFLEGLKDLKVDTSKEKIPSKKKLDILTQAIKEKVDGVTYGENCKIKISDFCQFKGYSIGKWITSMKRGSVTDEELLEGVQKLNIDLTREKRLTVEEKIDIISRAIKEKNEWINTNKNGNIYIGNYCEFEGYKIGIWVASVKSGATTNKKFIEALKKLKIDYQTRRATVYESDFKIELLKEAIKKEVKGIVKNSNGTIAISSSAVYEKDGEVYKVGEWISKAKYRENCDKDFIEKLKDLKVDLSKNKISPSEKLKIIEKALNSEEVKGIRTDSNGKHKIAQRCVFEEYNIGQWVEGVLNGSVINKEFIQGLVDLKIDLPQEVIELLTVNQEV